MNYEKEVMEQAYNILTKKNFEWGSEFNLEMKKSIKLNILVIWIKSYVFQKIQKRT